MARVPSRQVRADAAIEIADLLPVPKPPEPTAAQAGGFRAKTRRMVVGATDYRKWMVAMQAWKQRGSPAGERPAFINWQDAGNEDTWDQPHEINLRPRGNGKRKQRPRAQKRARVLPSSDDSDGSESDSDEASWSEHEDERPAKRARTSATASRAAPAAQRSTQQRTAARNRQPLRARAPSQRLREQAATQASDTDSPALPDGPAAMDESDDDVSMDLTSDDEPAAATVSIPDAPLPRFAANRPSTRTRAQPTPAQPPSTRTQAQPTRARPASTRTRAEPTRFRSRRVSP